MKNKNLPEGIQDFSYLKQYAYMKGKKTKAPREQKIQYKPGRSIKGYRSYGDYTMGEDTKKKLKQAGKIARINSSLGSSYYYNRICK